MVRRRKSMSRGYSKLRVVAALALVAIVAAPTGVAGGQAFSGEADEDLRAMVEELFDIDYTLVRTADEQADPVGDATDFNGEPRDTPHDITRADYLTVEGPVDPAALDNACDKGQLASGYGAVCPLERDVLKASREFVLLYALTGQFQDLSNFLQVAFGWANTARPVYEGPANDINQGRNASIDIYTVPGQEGHSLAQTRYVNAEFDFLTDYNGAMAIYGGRIVVFLVPVEQFVELCVNRAISAVWEGGVLDIALLGDEPSGTFTRTPPVEEQPASSEPPPAVEPPPVEEPAVQQPAPTPAPGDVEAPAEPAPVDDGDVGVGLFALVGLVVVVGGALTVIYVRKNRKDCREEEIAYGAARARADAAKERRNVAEAAWLEANGRLDRVRSTLTVAPREPVRPFPASEEGDERYGADLRLYEDQLAAYHQAQTELAEATEAEATARADRDAAVAEQNAAIDAENAARVALDECLGRARTRTRDAGGATTGGTGDPGGGGGEEGPQPGGQAPAAADDGCEPEGRERVIEDETVPPVHFTVAVGPVDVSLAATAAWRRFADGGGLEPTSFVASDREAFADALASLELPRGRSQGAVTARIDVQDVAMSCGRVEICEHHSWRPTGELRKIESRSERRSQNLGGMRWTDSAIVVDFLVGLQATVGALEDARRAVDAWEC